MVTCGSVGKEPGHKCLTSLSSHILILRAGPRGKPESREHMRGWSVMFPFPRHNRLKESPISSVS